MSSREEEARQFIRAQRLAKRTRASAACLPCKTKKAKCSDYRPCARCQKSPGLGDQCVDENPDITSNMYPANMTRAGSYPRDAVATHEGRPFHFVADFGSQRMGHSDSIYNFASDISPESRWREAFTATRVSQVRVQVKESFREFE